MKPAFPSLGQDCVRLLSTRDTGRSLDVGVPLYIPKSLLYIVTPCSRPDNLLAIRERLPSNQEWVWVIVYTVRPLRRAFSSDPRVYEFWPGVEANHEDDPTTYGNLGRNFGLGLVHDNISYIYFLDDDNIIHPKFWNFVYPVLLKGKNDFITFDQLHRPETILEGPLAILHMIDTAMFVTQRGLIGHKRWRLVAQDADGRFAAMMQREARNHTYINHVCAYHNFFKENFLEEASLSRK